MDYTAILFAVFGLLIMAVVAIAVAALIKGAEEDEKVASILKTAGLILLLITVVVGYCIVFGGLLYGALAK